MTRRWSSQPFEHSRGGPARGFIFDEGAVGVVVGGWGWARLCRPSPAATQGAYQYEPRKLICMSVAWPYYLLYLPLLDVRAHTARSPHSPRAYVPCSRGHAQASTRTQLISSPRARPPGLVATSQQSRVCACVRCMGAYIRVAPRHGSGCAVRCARVCVYEPPPCSADNARAGNVRAATHNCGHRSYQVAVGPRFTGRPSEEGAA